MKNRGVSYFRNYGSLFQDWEIGIAKRLINRFCADNKLQNPDDFNDLLMECLMHWLSKKNKYDPKHKASQKTFMATVIENKLCDIAERQQTDKRKIANLTDSLDKPLYNDSEATTLLDKINNDITFSSSEKSDLQVELKHDLSKAIPFLSPRQQKICYLFGEGFSIQEIGKCLVTPRSSIYYEIKRIRKVFEDKGLKIYLK